MSEMESSVHPSLDARRACPFWQCIKFKWQWLNHQRWMFCENHDYYYINMPLKFSMKNIKWYNFYLYVCFVFQGMDFKDNIMFDKCWGLQKKWSLSVRVFCFFVFKYQIAITENAGLLLCLMFFNPTYCFFLVFFFFYYKECVIN